ncbi:MAG: hypothetical protein SNH27_17940 [Rikenellaceae bacterium]
MRVKLGIPDGFTNFILPLDERSPFPTTFIDAINAEKSHNSNIRLTIMLPYEGEQAPSYTEYADEIIYNQQEYDIETPPNQVDNLLDRSAALIIYYERNCSQLHQITHHAQRNRLPIININL